MTAAMRKKLLGGKHVSRATFENSYNAESGDYFCIEVYDDRCRLYRPMGLGIVEPVMRYTPGEDGAFLKCRYKGCSPEDYRWYIENEGVPGGLPGMLCIISARLNQESARLMYTLVQLYIAGDWHPSLPKNAMTFWWNGDTQGCLWPQSLCQSGPPPRSQGKSLREKLRSVKWTKWGIPKGNQRHRA